MIVVFTDIYVYIIRSIVTCFPPKQKYEEASCGMLQPLLHSLAYQAKKVVYLEGWQRC